MRATAPARQARLLFLVLWRDVSYIHPMTDAPLIPASPSEDDYVRQVTEATPPPLLPEGDPIRLFEEWLAEAGKGEPSDPNAVALSTVDADGLPDSRMVLLKSVDARGFVFYTNTQSAKGVELGGQPKAALLFHWKSLRRQIRIEGTVSFATDAESDAYFASRARDSQLGAWASDQSRPLDSRDTFEARFEEVKARFEGQDVPRPPHWGGYRVTPSAIEFWQDRAHRLHERRKFTRIDGSWTECLLYP